ncbi:MAG: S8 family serine peptidase [Candidatus Thorarchaeota archaeon]|nr:S8 family serine peptidase [Candidatus Thorarchaeota archaeon]
MKRILCMLFAILLVSPILFVSFPSVTTSGSIPIVERDSIDFSSLKNEFKDDIPLVVRFDTQPSPSVLQDIRDLDIRFSLGSPDISKVGSYYLLRGSSNAFMELQERVLLEFIGVQTDAEYAQSTRDVSIPEINASKVWDTLDDLGRSVTGNGVLIADLDSGVDWTHPDLWYANGSEYDWIDFIVDSAPTNGSDYIDLDGSTTGTADETLYYLDLGGDSSFNTTIDWIWVDNVTQDGVPNIGEPFFVVNDTNVDDSLNPGEKLLMLNMPKTRYIVERDGVGVGQIQAWERNVNLTSSTHEDDDGHGSSVSGILVGGQIGYRRYVGVAPDAELMMIKVLGPSNERLTIEEGLAWAYNHGADVILIEIGSWTYEYLDGSSTAELLIETIVADGIPVIAPSGNLGGKDKHALFTAPVDTPSYVNFSIPQVGGPPTEGEYIDYDIEEVYITVLSINTTDFSTCEFSLVMNMAGTLVYIPLHPAVGMWTWFIEPIINVGGFTVRAESFIDTSSRGTSMLAIRLTGTLPTTIGPSWHALNISAPQETVFHSYISDDQSSWTGGCIWKTDVSDNYEITWPSTADSAISVASYRTRQLLYDPWNGVDTLDDIAGFSSRGPRIDEVAKQGVAAPGGFDIISTYSNASTWYSTYNAGGLLPFGKGFGSYSLFSGTSASGPHVAGCAALMIQVNASCGSDAGNVIMSTALSDSFTSITPNNEWGHGKLDVYGAVQQVNPIQELNGPNIGTPVTTPSIPDNSSDVIVTVTVDDPSGVDTVILKYYNGTHWNNLTMLGTGPSYSATIPMLPNGTIVTYRIYANDTLGNSSVSPDYQYTVQESGTSTTSTSTTTTNTSTTNTTSSTTPTSTTDVLEPDYLVLSLLLGSIAAFTIVGCIVSRRREQ